MRGKTAVRRELMLGEYLDDCIRYSFFKMSARVFSHQKVKDRQENDVNIKTYQDPSVVSMKPANPTSKDLFTRPADDRNTNWVQTNFFPHNVKKPASIIDDGNVTCGFETKIPNHLWQFVICNRDIGVNLLKTLKFNSWKTDLYR